MVTDEQVRLLRKKQMQGMEQEAAAAAAGMSVRTARQWQDGPMPSETKKPRDWRTRQDPFEEMWESDVVPLLEADTKRKLEAKAVLEELAVRYPDKIEEGQLRTLQRRFRDWRALHGPDREVFFEQAHRPGAQGNVDFTEAASPVRIRPGKSNQNGIVEKGHDLLKRRMEQALQLRGSRDFSTQDEYLAFVREQTEYVSRGGRAKLDEERNELQALPATKVPSYTKFHPKVRRHSTIRIGGRIYSVPSRLIGHTVEVRQHADEVEVLYKGKLVQTMPRLRGDKNVRIDYRHVIWSLVHKPGAFALYRYREELFPTPAFSAAYGAFKTHRGERADIEYVRVLHLAASTMQVTVERALLELLAEDRPFDYLDVKDKAAPEPTSVPEIRIGVPDLSQYDELLEVAR